MQRLEKFSAVFLIAGVLLFIVAVVALAIVPVLMLDKEKPYELAISQVPEDFTSHYANTEDYEKALHQGRDIYIREGCWHCHSQYVRPVSNETARYGPVSTPGEYQNSLNLPQLFGTRRVGPDLSREAGIKNNDWHFAHLYDPTSVVPESVMPRYPWLFRMAGGEPVMEDDEPVTDDDGNPVLTPVVPKPTAEGVALVAYLQWLGSSVEARPGTVYDFEKAVLPPAE